MTEPESARAAVTDYFRYGRDPWLFLSECVFTLDQVDRERPIKPFPSDLQYLQLFTRCWEEYLSMAVPKSRRMTMSWTCIALYLWDTIFHEGRFNGFVSKKEDDAGELVSRAEFIYHHIPTNRIPKALLPKIKNGKMSKQPPVLDFEDINSKIQGFPMGSDQLRQFTLSGILGDECAFWEEDEKFYSASRPTLDGGGRMTLISSRSPSFFKKIVFDRLDADTLTFPETPASPVRRPMQGVEINLNPKNGFLVFDLSYEANPAKRSKEWVTGVMNTMPRKKFLMEYGKAWQTYEGLPVFIDTFSKANHISEFGLTPRLGLPLLLGWDFGLTPACIVGQLCEGQLLILEEFIGNNVGTVKFSEYVWSELRRRYTVFTNSDDGIFSFIDPAGLAKNQVDERTNAQALREAGFVRIEPGPIDNESRKEAVEFFLSRQTKHGSAYLLDPKKCPTLTEGFSGGYRYDDKELNVQSRKLMPIKDRYSHPHDANQYLCHGARGQAKRHLIKLGAPSYGFQKYSGKEESA